MKASLEEIRNLFVKKLDYQAAWRALKTHSDYLSYYSKTGGTNYHLLPLFRDLTVPATNEHSELFRQKMIAMVNYTQNEPGKPIINLRQKQFKASQDQIFQITERSLLNLAKQLKQQPEEILKCHQFILQNIQTLRFSNMKGVLELVKLPSPLKIELAKTLLTRMNQLNSKSTKYFFVQFFTIFGQDYEPVTVYHNRALKKGYISLSVYLRNLSHIQKLHSNEIDFIQRVINSENMQSCISDILHLTPKMQFYFSQESKDKVFKYFCSKKVQLSTQIFFLLRSCQGDKDQDQWERITKMDFVAQDFRHLKSILKLINFRKMNPQSIPHLLVILWKLIDYHIDNHKEVIEVMLRNTLNFKRQQLNFREIPIRTFQKNFDIFVAKSSFPVLHQVDFNSQSTDKSGSELHQGQTKDIEQIEQQQDNLSHKDQLLNQLKSETPNQERIMKIVLRSKGFEEDPNYAKIASQFIVKNIHELSLKSIILLKKVYRQLKKHLPKNFYEALVSQLGTQLTKIDSQTAYKLIAEFKLVETFDAYTIRLFEQKLSSSLHRFRPQRIYKVIRLFNQNQLLTYGLVKQGVAGVASELREGKSGRDHRAVLRILSKYKFICEDIIEALKAFLKKSIDPQANESHVKMLLNISELHDYPDAISKDLCQNLGDQFHSKIYKFLAGQHTLKISQSDMRIISTKYLNLAENNQYVIELAKLRHSQWSSKSILPFIPQLVSQEIKVAQIQIKTHHHECAREYISYFLAKVSQNLPLQDVFKCGFPYNGPMPTKLQFRQAIRYIHKVGQYQRNSLQVLIGKQCFDNPQLTCLIMQIDGIWSQNFIDRVLYAGSNRKYDY